MPQKLRFSEYSWFPLPKSLLNPSHTGWQCVADNAHACVTHIRRGKWYIHVYDRETRTRSLYARNERDARRIALDELAKIVRNRQYGASQLTLKALLKGDD